MSKTFSINEMCYIAGAVVIFVLVVVVLVARAMEDCMLKGFWRATDHFCAEAELELFILYIGDNSSYLGNCRPSFILAANESGIILNNPIDIDFGYSLQLVPCMASCKKYNASIDWHDEPPEDDAFPTDLQIAFYPAYGKLVLYKDDSVLAILWKDQEMSAMDVSTRLMPGEIPEEEDAGAETITE